MIRLKFAPALGSASALGITLVFICAAQGALAAEPFPSRPVRMVVPAAAGGALDITSRLVAQKMAEHLGQPVVVENRPGADSLLGTWVVKNASADGYTLLAHSNAFSALAVLKKEPGYDPVSSFAPIGMMLRSAQVMYLSPTEPDRTVPEFVARAKAKPGALSYAHGGVGSPLHLAAAQFVRHAGIDVLAVPYKGAGSAYPDVAGGRVSSIFAGYAGGASYVQSGKLRPLAVTGNERLAALPQVPTFREQGVDFTYFFWLGLLAPAGTPSDVIERLSGALRFATGSKELVERFRADGAEATTASPAELATAIARELADVEHLMKAPGMHKE